MRSLHLQRQRLAFVFLADSPSFMQNPTLITLEVPAATLVIICWKLHGSLKVLGKALIQSRFVKKNCVLKP
jgi:hypothetical protein